MTKPTQTDIVEVSRHVLSSNSRTFSWAAWFLPAARRDDAAVVYALCRLIDDLADDDLDPDRARIELDQLRAELKGRRPHRSLAGAFLEVADRRDLDIRYALELINGVKGDTQRVRMGSDRPLLRYCYRVAGTVGLMMCAVLGIDDPRALPHAIDLGVAMQLTNICRDVLEDARHGRVYLPADRLHKVGVDPDTLVGDHAPLDADSLRPKVAAVVCDLLDLADRYYHSANGGMDYIPPRSRLGILVASRMYRAIGVQLRHNDGDSLAGRTIVSRPMKSWWVVVALSVYCTSTFSGAGPTRGHDETLHAALDGLPGSSHHRRQPQRASTK